MPGHASLAPEASSRLPTLSCAGVPVTACLPREAADEVIRLASSVGDSGADVHLCNAYTIALADKNPEFRSLLRRAALNLPDGKSVVWANQILHRDAVVPDARVYGPDLFLDVLARGRAAGLRHFLLGSTPEVLERLALELARRFPDAAIVGTSSPPFRQLSETETTEQIRLLSSSRAQIVWLGLGTPKQDWEAARLAATVPAVFCAVGAAFDFVAGTKRQAPAWMQERGLEWLFRLATEPRRLGRRYVFGNARFLLAVAGDARWRARTGEHHRNR